MYKQRYVNRTERQRKSKDRWTLRNRRLGEILEKKQTDFVKFYFATLCKGKFSLFCQFDFD